MKNLFLLLTALLTPIETLAAGVINGQPVNAAVTNAAFLFKNGDDTVSNILTFNKEEILKFITTPVNPSTGYMKLYVKNDNNLYVLNSAGTESKVSNSAITQLTGDVLAGPGTGSQVATVAYVGGKSAASVATAVTSVQLATSSSTASTLVVRDSTGSFAASNITASLLGNATNVTGVVTETHGGTNQATYAAGDLLYASSSNTLTKLSAGANGTVLTMGPSLPSWQASSAPSIPTSSTDLTNAGLLTSVSAGALTIAIKQSDGLTNPSTGSASVNIAFRSSSASTGSYNIRSITSAQSIVIPSGASLGQASTLDQYVWVYLMDNAGSPELAVSGVTLFPDYSIQSSTTISAGATSGSVLYSTTGRSNLPIRLLGRLLVNEPGAGLWMNAPTDINLFPRPTVTTSEIVSYSPTISNFGTTPTAVSFLKWRVGPNLHVLGQWTSAASPGPSTASVSLPSGLVVSTALASTQVVGKLNSTTFGTGFNGTGVALAVPLQANILFGIECTSCNSLSAMNGNAFGGSGITYSVEASIPIQGWSMYGP